MPEVRIADAEAWMCRLPLPWPVRLGLMVYRTRDYVVLKLASVTGLEGWAVGYTRGTPLLESAYALASTLPHVLDGPQAARSVWRRRHAPGWTSLVRAASLFDICAWDLAAKQSNEPLARALGGKPVPVPLMAVAGYFIDDRGESAVIDEAIRFADEGFAVVKVMLPGHSRGADERLVNSIRSALPAECSLAVDLHGMFATLDESIDYSAWLSAAGVDFIEDPFPSSEWREVAAFQASTTVPIASGEDLTGLGGFLDLMDGGVQNIRLDATASGGITGAIEVLDAASRRPVGILPHVWPHVHAHLASVSPQIPFVEVIPKYVGADPMWALLADGPTYRDGRWLATDVPGIGMNMDIASLERHAVAHWQLTIESELNLGSSPTPAREEQ